MADVRTGETTPNVGLLASHSQIVAYRVAEFVTLAHDGSPVGWPLTPDLEGNRLAFPTG